MEHMETRRRENSTGTKTSGIVSKPKAHKSKARILVVDDEIHILETVRDLLEFRGFEVETARKGNEAIRLLASAQPFDLLIADIRMPEMGGLEVLKWVQEFAPRLPVIVMTGYPEVDNGMECIQAGVVDYITKPFKFGRLCDSVEECLRNSRLEEEEIAQAV